MLVLFLLHPLHLYASEGFLAVGLPVSLPLLLQLVADIEERMGAHGHGTVLLHFGEDVLVVVGLHLLVQPVDDAVVLRQLLQFYLLTGPEVVALQFGTEGLGGGCQLVGSLTLALFCLLRVSLS